MKGSNGALEEALVRIREPFETGAIRGSAPWLAAFRTLTFPTLIVGREHRFVAEESGVPIRIACVGFPRRFESFLSEIFPDLRYEGRGRRRFMLDPEGLSGLGDLVLVDVHATFIGAFERAGWWIVPETLRWIGRAAGLPPRDATESLKADMRKIERLRYSFEEAGAAADWDEFFERMVIPHLRQRFGDEARLPSAATRRLLREDASLFFVRRDGARVSGGCLLHTPPGVVLRRVGVRDGDDRLLRDGALTALYLFLFEWAKALGLAEFDSGTTLPLPRSGLARFKAKLGLEPHGQPGAMTTGLHYDRRSAAAAAFERQPFFHLAGDRIEVHP